MKTAFLAIAGAAVAITAAPADARHRHHARHGHAMVCARWHHHHCVRWRHLDAYRVGYLFGPRYAYTEFGALPGPIVTRYSLRPTYRYVTRNGFVYVVSPRTYRVVRVIRR